LQEIEKKYKDLKKKYKTLEAKKAASKGGADPAEIKKLQKKVTCYKAPLFLHENVAKTFR